MELQYIKTDRNGTKWYNDWTCPRCGGAGASDKWLFTGRICYECGGTGKRRTPKIVKSYTPEYEAKLAAKRAAREEKRAQEYEAEKPKERRMVAIVALCVSALMTMAKLTFTRVIHTTLKTI